MQTIKIIGIENKSGTNAKGNWTMYHITGEGNTKFSTFDNAASVLQTGDTIEAEVKVQGKYANILTFRKVDGIAPTPHQTPKEAPQPPKSYPTTTQPISGAEKGMILKEIGDNFRAKVFTPATQPDLWNYYKSEIGRVTGVKIN